MLQTSRCTHVANHVISKQLFLSCSFLEMRTSNQNSFKPVFKVGGRGFRGHVCSAELNERVVSLVRGREVAADDLIGAVPRWYKFQHVFLCFLGDERYLVAAYSPVHTQVNVLIMLESRYPSTLVNLT